MFMPIIHDDQDELNTSLLQSPLICHDKDDMSISINQHNELQTNNNTGIKATMDENVND